MDGGGSPLWVLLAIFLFQLAVSYWVLTHSDIVCVFDESARFAGANRFQDESLSLWMKVSLFFKLDLWQGHPHFVEGVAGLVWRVQDLFGNVEFRHVILLTNAVFGLILIFSVYGLGSMIYGRQAGLLAAFMISMLPVVFAHSRTLMLDYPLMCMVALSFWILYRTRAFSSLKFCFFFGIAAAFSQLTKGSAVIFMGVPWLYYFANAFLTGRRDVVVRGALVSLLVYVAITGGVYFSPQNSHVFSLYQQKAGMFSAGVLPMYYLREIDKIIGFSVFWISIPFLATYLARLKNRDLFLFFWFFILLAVLNASPNKAPRFLLPIMPAFALIVSGEAVAFLRTKFVGIVSVGVLIAGLSAQFYFSNIPVDRSVHLELASYGRPSRQRDGLSSVRKQILDAFRHEADRVAPDRRCLVWPLFNAPRILDILRVKFFINKMPFFLDQPLQYERSFFLRERWGNNPERVLQADYLLLDSGSIPGRIAGNFLEKVLKDGFARYKAHYEKISEISLGKGARIDIYRKRPGTFQIDANRRAENTSS